MTMTARAPFPAQPVEQPQDARLHRDVQRRGRLIGDKQSGLGSQRDRNRDALSHAAGELTRIGAQRLLGIGYAYSCQHADSAARVSASLLLTPR